MSILTDLAPRHEIQHRLAELTMVNLTLSVEVDGAGKAHPRVAGENIASRLADIDCDRPEHRRLLLAMFGDLNGPEASHFLHQFRHTVDVAYSAGLFTRTTPMVVVPHAPMTLVTKQQLHGAIQQKADELRALLKEADGSMGAIGRHHMEKAQSGLHAVVYSAEAAFESCPKLRPTVIAPVTCSNEVMR